MEMPKINAFVQYLHGMERILDESGISQTLLDSHK